MLYRKVEGIYRYVVHQRKDDDGSVFYFSHEDFEGLRACPYPFLSRDGQSPVKGRCNPAFASFRYALSRERRRVPRQRFAQGQAKSQQIFTFPK